jgi:hypothetical protein
MMKIWHLAVKMLSLVIVMLWTVSSTRGAGQILSSFDTGVTDIYGLDIREDAGTQLHLVTGNGSVYRFVVDTASAVKNGIQSQYDSIFRMTGSANSAIPLRGLAIIPTNEGSYATTYIAVQDNLTQYRSRWGVDGNPGTQTWGLINGAWSLNMDGDITPASRSTLNSDIWSVRGQTIYRYPYALWIDQGAYNASFTLSKALRGVSLGDNNDLWVLCQDGQILNVSSLNGSILRSFNLPSSIAQPWGIAYDSGEGSLWISNHADNRIYQISTTTTWQINTQTPGDPLVYTAPNGKSVHPTVNMGPVFIKADGSTISAGSYTATVTSASVVDGYTILNCRATATGFSANYKLKFHEIAPADSADPNWMEVIVEADPADRTTAGYVPVASFYPGTFQATGVKQFYTGERGIEAFPGNYGSPALLYWSTGGMYFYGRVDGDYSNADGSEISQNPKYNFIINNPQISISSKYDPLSNGVRPILKDRYVIQVSSNLWNAYGPQTNNPSTYRNELAGMLFFDDWSDRFSLGKYALNWLKDVAGGKLNFYTIVQAWGNGGFDDSDPDAYRIPDHNTPSPVFGTKAQLVDYVNFGKTAGRIGLRCNYMVAANGSWSLVEGFVKRALNADGTAAWFTGFNSVIPLVNRQETDIATDFATTAVFHDQWTSGNPGNMDGSMAGAENPGAATQADIRQICQIAKTIHQGPMSSESLFVEYLLGEYVDTGDFGIMDGYTRYDFFPEYKLRRLHSLSTFHGMGLGHRYFTGISDIEAGNKIYFGDDDAMDSYRACEVLYGNGAYLFHIAGDRYGLRKIHALTECFTVGVAQRYYALQQLDYVQYGYNGQWKTFDQIIPSSNSLAEVQAWFKQFHIRYTNGCHVWVNRAAANLAVTLPNSTTLMLPQNSWAVYTEDGNLIAYTALSGSSDPDPGKRVDFCQDLSRGIKYVNPRTTSSYKGVTKPTVWYNDEIHLVLDDPTETFAGAYLKEAAKPIHGVHIGDVLSSFATGESQVWGLDVTGIAETTLHLMGVNGQVFTYNVDSVKAITNGSLESWDSKIQLMSSSTNLTLRGLAILPTWEGPSGTVYIAGQDTRAQYRTRYGLDGEIGSMNWNLINNPNVLYIGGDITPASRSQENPDFWCTYSNKIYRYPYAPWVAQAGYTKLLTLPKTLRGVSLGDRNDLWVLCLDREILRISDTDGTILERFYLPSVIGQPWGIAYDRKGSLWIANQVDKKIYQIAVEEETKIPGDANGDGMVDVGDLGILAANYGSSGKSWAQGDFNGDTIVDVGDLGILAAHYGEGTDATTDFNADYSKAFSSFTIDEDDSANETSETVNTIPCNILSLPLIVGLMLAGLVLVKLQSDR